MWPTPPPPNALPGSFEGQWEIDWEHPINQGLVFRVLFDDVNAPIDMVTGWKGVPAFGPTQTVVDGQPAANLAGASNQYYNFGNNPLWHLLADKTLLWQGLIRNSGGYTHFFGNGTGGDGSATPFGFWVAPTPAAVFYIAANTGYVYWQGPNISLNAPHTVAVRASTLIQSTPTFYIDGAVSSGFGNAGGGTGAPTAGLDMQVGRRVDGAVQMDGITAHTAAWSRQLAYAEIDDLRANPRLGLKRAAPWFMVGASGASYTLVADPGAYTLTGAAAQLPAARLLDAGSGTYALSGVAAQLGYTRVLSADPGSYALSGADATLVAARLLSADPTAYSLSGVSAVLAAGRLLTADPGAYSLSGADAVLAAARLLAADPGTYTLSGISATLMKSGSGYILIAEPGAYDLTGAAAQITANRVLNAESGAYTLSGSVASVLAGRQLSADPGAYALLGADASVLAMRRLSADPGAYSLSGVDAALLAGRLLSATPGVYILTGYEISELADILFSAPSTGRLVVFPSDRRRVLFPSDRRLILFPRDR